MQDIKTPAQRRRIMHSLEAKIKIRGQKLQSDEEAKVYQALLREHTIKLVKIKHGAPIIVITEDFDRKKDTHQVQKALKRQEGYILKQTDEIRLVYEGIPDKLVSVSALAFDPTQSDRRYNRVMLRVNKELTDTDKMRYDRWLATSNSWLGNS